VKLVQEFTGSEVHRFGFRGSGVLGFGFKGVLGFVFKRSGRDLSISRTAERERLNPNG
jgi:hypothetical protein